MKRFDSSDHQAETISRFGGSCVRSTDVGRGTGYSHAYCLYQHPDIGMDLRRKRLRTIGRG